MRLNYRNLAGKVSRTNHITEAFCDTNVSNFTDKVMEKRLLLRSELKLHASISSKGQIIAANICTTTISNVDILAKFILNVIL